MVIEKLTSDGVLTNYIEVEYTADFTNTVLEKILEIRGTVHDNFITSSAQNDIIYGYKETTRSTAA